MSGQIEQRSFPLDLAAIELRQDNDDGPRRVAWYPALFDTLSEDLGGFRERIGRRAFTDTLSAREVRALVNHDPSQILSRTSNKTLRVGVDQTGLRADSAVPDTSYARDLLVNLGNGNIGGGSFMFVTREGDDEWVRWSLEDIEGNQVLVRTVRKAQLYDVSLVTFPAYVATEGTASLRSLADEWRQRLTVPPIDVEAIKARAGHRKRTLELKRLASPRRP
jgi:HK97 family phage prohead protease